MKKILLASFCLIALSFGTHAVSKTENPPKVVFALVEEGKMVEPIVRIEDGKLIPALDEEGGLEFPEFAALYYKPGKVYRMVTGGKLSGSVTVIKNDPGSECGAIMATVKTVSPVLKLSGNEMSLATDFKPLKAASGLRRNASAAEKATIEKLVRKAFNDKIILVKNLKQVKLSVLDVDNDKKPEIVGTYICTPKLKERAVLFFIAAKSKSGAYSFQYSDLQQYREDEVMSNDITAVDDGVYLEKLLDILDTDNSGVAKIFTTTPSFEGVGFTIYKRDGTGWQKLVEFSNYHCAY